MGGTFQAPQRRPSDGSLSWATRARQRGLSLPVPLPVPLALPSLSLSHIGTHMRALTHTHTTLRRWSGWRGEGAGATSEDRRGQSSGHRKPEAGRGRGHPPWSPRRARARRHLGLGPVKLFQTPGLQIGERTTVLQLSSPRSFLPWLRGRLPTVGNHPADALPGSRAAPLSPRDGGGQLCCCALALTEPPTTGVCPVTHKGALGGHSPRGGEADLGSQGDACSSVKVEEHSRLTASPGKLAGRVPRMFQKWTWYTEGRHNETVL